MAAIDRFSSKKNSASNVLLIIYVYFSSKDSGPLKGRRDMLPMCCRHQPRYAQTIENPTQLSALSVSPFIPHMLNLPC